MPISVLMPALSPTMKEGKLSNWLKKEGDIIESGDALCEIETDKATMEVEAVDDGILGKIIVSEGSEGVEVNTTIAIILEEGEKAGKLVERTVSTRSWAGITCYLANANQRSSSKHDRSNIKGTELCRQMAGEGQES